LTTQRNISINPPAENHNKKLSLPFDYRLHPLTKK
jgi:hypothetical protein